MPTLAITSTAGTVTYTVPTGAGPHKSTGRWLLECGLAQAADPRVQDVFVPGVDGAAMKNEGLGLRSYGPFRVLHVDSSYVALTAAVRADLAKMENQDAALLVIGPDAVGHNNCRLMRGYPKPILGPCLTEANTAIAEFELLFESAGT